MTKGDAAVESAADKLDRFVRNARTSGGVKGKVGHALSDDPDFLRKLKPSLIKARAKGEAPTDEPSGGRGAHRPARSSRAEAEAEARQRAEPVARDRRGARRWLRARKGDRLERSCPPP